MMRKEEVKGGMSEGRMWDGRKFKGEREMREQEGWREKKKERVGNRSAEGIERYNLRQREC